VFDRSLVHALPLGGTHNMGAKDGLFGGQWQRSKAISDTTT